ncbi:MAG: hypothetical protein HYR80_06290 [Nitrospirae bacterium]|nr:hypothetical protein [Nitrospirota bacterium]
MIHIPAFKIFSILGNFFKVFFNKWPTYHDAHLRDIKEKVIIPVKDIILRYYIPILQFSTSNLFVGNDSIYSDQKKVSKPIIMGYQEKIKTKEISWPEVPVGHEIHELLFRDVIDCHNKSCLEYANRIKIGLLEKSGLSDTQRGINSQKRWINSNELAVFIYERQMGINTFGHLIEQFLSDGSRELYLEGLGRSFAKVDGVETEKIKTLIELCDELFSNETEVKKLKLEAKTLLDEISKLSIGIEKFLSGNRLPEKCFYIKNYDYLKAILVLIVIFLIGFVVGKYFTFNSIISFIKSYIQ